MPSATTPPYAAPSPPDFDSIPELDWSLVASGDPIDRKLFLSKLRNVLLHVGFMYLKNHPVPTELVERIKQHTVDVFNLPLERKLKMDMIDSPHFYGYNRMAFERTAGAPDIREHIDLGPDSPSTYDPSSGPLYRKMRPGPNPWPDQEDAPGFKEDVKKYIATLAPLSREFIGLVAEAIGLPRESFYQFLEAADVPQGRIKMVHYPPTDTPNAQGVGPHKDGWLTFLLQVNDVPGLQVQNHSGKWVDVPPRDGTYVVNLGKGLQHLTHGVLLATTHRVLPPPPGVHRYSCPFFQDVALDVPWTPLDVPEEVRREVGARGEVVSDVKPLEPAGASDGWQYLANRIKSHPATGLRHYPDFARMVLGEEIFLKESATLDKLLAKRDAEI
ncbi:Clavaminate synthase-like protein [Gonapodya prolifera JEL478]|uniref:Clavaminate synthase-like protein n=1 Tax=Gonapodya prolifera (strain JEL478) TaxID=1344416 RepID=A0A139A9L3_GONPJ|nr:Clavaminate synthase-like protein [Gonapodya prolifera JEL478]|eukprot:KXS13358.1 Clavaminate synthase-like protein [Gonapodya prolifera JEL478]